MPFISIGTAIAGSLVSGALQGGAAESAGQTAANAQNRATDTQLQMFNTQNQQQAPYRQAGYSALGELMQGIGVSPSVVSSTPMPTRDQFMTANPGGAGYAGGGGNYTVQNGRITDGQGNDYGQAGTQWVTDDVNSGTGHWQTNGVNTGSNISTALPAAVNGAGGSTFDQAGYDAAVKNWQAQQAQAQSAASGSMPLGYFNHQFNANDLNDNLAPNYAFMRDQGLGATANQLNRSGGYLSGNALQGINTFAQNYAQNAYQQAYNNYTANQSNIFNRLSTLAGLGNSANSQSAQLTGQLAPSIASTQVGAGQAQAAGTIGAANALAGAGNNAMGWYQLGNLANNNQSSNAAYNQGMGDIYASLAQEG